MICVKRVEYLLSEALGQNREAERKKATKVKLVEIAEEDKIQEIIIRNTQI